MENKKIKNLITVLGAIFVFFAISNIASAASYSPVYAFSNNQNDTYPVYESYWTYNPSMTYYGNPVSPQYVTNASTTSANTTTASTTTKPTSTVVNNYYYGDTKVPANTITTTTGTNSNPTIIPVTSEMTSGTMNGVNYANNLGASAYYPYYTQQATGTNIGNSIPALSMKGSGGFLPSSVWQWIFVVILILVIIIISRSFVKKAVPGDPYNTGKPLN